MADKIVRRDKHVLTETESDTHLHILARTCAHTYTHTRIRTHIYMHTCRDETLTVTMQLRVSEREALQGSVMQCVAVCAVCCS